MKNNLIISKYKTEEVQGTKSVYDNRTFFGSKMIELEDDITIDNFIIQYSEVYDTLDKRNTGYQYYNDINNIERKYLIFLDKLKNNNQIITMLSQNLVDLTVNTNWLLIIDWKTILTDYLFYKLKEARTFKTIKYNDTTKENINLYIYDYIEHNLLSRYDFKSIDLYVEYFKLDQNDKEIDVKLSYNPIFDVSVRKTENKIANMNSTKFTDKISLNYKQTKTSEKYMFKYYFDLYLTRI